MTDKSSDYAIKPRQCRQPKYGNDLETAERNTYNFGYEEPVEIHKATPKSRRHKQSHSKQEIGVKGLTLKFTEDEFDSDTDDGDLLPSQFTYSKSMVI